MKQIQGRKRKAETNEIKNENNRKKSINQKLIFKKINTIDKHLARQKR